MGSGCCGLEMFIGIERHHVLWNPNEGYPPNDYFMRIPAGRVPDGKTYELHFEKDYPIEIDPLGYWEMRYRLMGIKEIKPLGEGV